VTRVLVAAGSGLRRAAMIRLLEDAGFEVTGQAGDAGDLQRKARAHRPDVAIAELPDTQRALDEYVQVLRTIRGELRVGVLLISQEVEAGHAAALLELGAEGAGYLLEGRVTGVARFIEAVRDVAACGSVLDTEVVTRLMARERRNPVFDELSERDREVLAQMAAGVTNRGIARRMFLSERAIERHVTSIFDALGITAARQANRRVLAVLAYLRGGEPA
jgi:DNA-binding NarL/FixJ family response regulator